MNSDSDEQIELTPAQRKRLLQEQALEMKRKRAQKEQDLSIDREEEEEDWGEIPDATPLVNIAAEIRKKEADDPNADQKRFERKEQQIIDQIQYNKLKTLTNMDERVIGDEYTEPMKTSWKPPQKILNKPQSYFESIREKYKIDVDGEDIPPLITKFAEMKFPEPILEGLKEKGIFKPTPIQVQALPAILSGRDLVGISYTGSGKTLVFVLPLIMFALEEERKLSFQHREGPVGIILSPSRELAIQTYEIIQFFIQKLDQFHYEHLHAVLCIGGEERSKQITQLRSGCHIVIATPGRLIDLTKNKIMLFHSCKYLCLDEADHLLDTGFDESIQELLSNFHHQRQTVLFSATFPRQLIEFVQQSLVKPVIVNVNRAGAANMDILQSFHIVDEYDKPKFIVSKCLNKTKPPVLIFCLSQQNVDLLLEYLTIKGINVCETHGGISQEERNQAVKSFKEGKADVLIATDVAAKGLDFPIVRHVINFDLPQDIETYVHRIGRTGRRGHHGVATTLLSGSDIGDPKHPPSILLDIKHLLKEAEQQIPPLLMRLEDPNDLCYDQNTSSMNKGCAYCGGLGHKVSNCPKLYKLHKQVVNRKEKNSFVNY